MLSLIPLVLFGSLAAAAFVDDGETPETQDHTDDDLDGASGESAEAEMASGALNLLDIDYEEDLPAPAPTATAADTLDMRAFAAAFLESLDDEEDEDEDVDADDQDGAQDEDEPFTLTLVETTAPPVSATAVEPGVIAIEVDDDILPLDDELPGPEEGFRSKLASGDELTLNIADDVNGRIAAVQSVHDHPDGDSGTDILSYSLNFYLVPDDITLPEDGFEGSESDFIDTYEAQKLGELDLGRFETAQNAETGEVRVTEDSRQIDPPKIVSNRSVEVLDALFSGPPA